MAFPGRNFPVIEVLTATPLLPKSAACPAYSPGQRPFGAE